MKPSLVIPILTAILLVSTGAMAREKAPSVLAKLRSCDLALREFGEPGRRIIAFGGEDDLTVIRGIVGNQRGIHVYSAAGDTFYPVPDQPADGEFWYEVIIPGADGPVTKYMQYQKQPRMLSPIATLWETRSPSMKPFLKPLYSAVDTPETRETLKNNLSYLINHLFKTSRVLDIPDARVHKILESCSTSFKDEPELRHLRSQILKLLPAQTAPAAAPTEKQQSAPAR